MDPSLSLSSDRDPRPPHHARQHFKPFAPFPVSATFGAPPAVTNSAVFRPTSANAATNNHHAGEAPEHALRYNTSNHPHYVDMICIAIAGLNEQEGSSKQAISRFIERVYSDLPSAHDALVTHHLTCLKNRGVLVMVRNCYKFSTSPPFPSALEASRLDSNALPQKRGRGRPRKAKPEGQILGAQPKTADRVVVQPNLQDGSNPGQDQPIFSACEPSESETLVAKRRPGRPRKNGAQMQTAPVNAFTRHRGQPLGGRSPGRLRKSKPVTAPAMVFPYVANGARHLGRPKRAESVVGVPAVAEGRATVSSSKRRGRPPKIGGVVGKPMKSSSRSGRPVGRPRKNGTQNNAAYEELKRKLGFFQETIKQAIGVLKAQLGGENQVSVLAIRELEELVTMDTDDAAAPAEKV